MKRLAYCTLYTVVELIEEGVKMRVKPSFYVVFKQLLYVRQRKMIEGLRQTALLPLLHQKLSHESPYLWDLLQTRKGPVAKNRGQFRFQEQISRLSSLVHAKLFRPPTPGIPSSVQPVTSKHPYQVHPDKGIPYDPAPHSYSREPQQLKSVHSQKLSQQ